MKKFSVEYDDKAKKKLEKKTLLFAKESKRGLIKISSVVKILELKARNLKESSVIIGGIALGTTDL